MTAIKDLPPTHPLRAALDSYSAALEQHRCDYANWNGGFRSCVCGRSFKSANGCGLHVAAEHRRAEKACDAASAAWISAHGGR